MYNFRNGVETEHIRWINDQQDKCFISVCYTSRLSRTIIYNERVNLKTFAKPQVCFNIT